jgi:hypothetical protein
MDAKDWGALMGRVARHVGTALIQVTDERGIPREQMAAAIVSKQMGAGLEEPLREASLVLEAIAEFIRRAPPTHGPN